MNRNLLITFLFFVLFLSKNFTVKSQAYKTEKEFKEYLLANNQTLDPIEGIWEFNKNIKSGFRDITEHDKKIEFPSYNLGVAPYKVAIIKASENNFFCYYINILAEITEIDACGSYWFKSTAVEGQYIYDVGGSCKEMYHDKAFINQYGDLKFEGKFEDYKSDVLSWNNFSVSATKLSLTQTEIKNYNAKIVKEEELLKPKFSFGTGCAVTNNLIVTCYHVVKHAKQILIRGVNGDFEKTYNAELYFYDEYLDVAYLKLSDGVISKQTIIPYTFKSKKSDVGENIFVLGYPLQNTMGQEIKLTTGVISSNSGFMGDTTLFQISAPIQPGNSGGPLFDNYGNLIGLVTAKHLKADNVGYAVKLILQNDFLKDNGVHFSSLKKLSVDLSQKVKLYKKYIFSIEVTIR